MPTSIVHPERVHWCVRLPVLRVRCLSACSGTSAIRNALPVLAEGVQRMLLARAFRRAFPQVRVLEASHGLAACEAVAYSMATGACIAAITMDGEMPQVNGYDATRRIRAMGFRGQIIGVTGNAVLADQAKFTEAGADGVFIKPVNLQQLIAILRDALGTVE